MNLIIINGLPATGKTTIAQQIAKQYDLKLISKDTIKEFLFDVFGVEDREWSRKLGGISNDFLYEITELALKSGKSIIIENAFETAFAKPRLQELTHAYDVNVAEVYCSCDPAVRRKRFVDRNESGSRHVGHMDKDNYPKPEDEEPLEKYAPLNVGTFIEHDTTRGDNAVIQETLSKLRVILD
jgi:predicted kinase